MEECCSKTVKSHACDHDIKQLSTRLKPKDIWGTVKARCGVGRMDYKVPPGLYKIGNPDGQSHVFVTGNYKMSVDSLRKELKRIACWILVLDTKGVNVWCAAGKGTFGTDELINRIGAVNLTRVVSHKRIILPQLGAAGVAAHEVKKKTGFGIIYGPVRAEDIPEFLKNDCTADKKMRSVRFCLGDRAILIPMEVSGAVKPTLCTLGTLLILNALGLTKVDAKDVKAYLGSVFIGTVLVPALLPIIPVRAFSLKGWLVGMVWALFSSKKAELPKTVPYMLILPSVSAMHAFNFTGSSTFTSMSGVKKEAKIAVPVFGASIFAGILLMIRSQFSK